MSRGRSVLCSEEKVRDPLEPIGILYIAMSMKDRKPTQSGVSRPDDRSFAVDLTRIEFHRHGLALFPEPSDRRPGVALLVDDAGSGLPQGFCSCSIYQKHACNHLNHLKRLSEVLLKICRGKTLAEDFRESIWFRLAEVLSEGSKETPKTVRARVLNLKGNPVIRVCNKGGEELVRHFGDEAVRHRFVERCIRAPERDAVPDRGHILDRLALMTLTDTEKILHDRGFQSRRQAMEGCFWYRVAYHGYREAGTEGCTFHPAIEESSGAFMVSVRNAQDETLFRMVIPRSRVSRMLQTLRTSLPNQHNLAIHPIPLKSIFKVSAVTQLDLEVRPLIQVIQENGESRFFEREDLERFSYGNLFYIKEMGLLAELEPEGPGQRRFGTPVRMVLKKSQVPSFVEAFSDNASESARLVDEDLNPLRIIRAFDRIQITPASLDRDWCWLSVAYGFGNLSVSLSEILSAKAEGRRYVATKGGWVDCESPALDGVSSVLERFGGGLPSGEAGHIGLSRLDVLRMYAGADYPVDISGAGSESFVLRRMLDLRPAREWTPLKGLTSPLRPYQERGVAWLHFLFENGFGGLLCDEMGLGKTHEVMAFMVGLQEQGEDPGPFLVVCPTTVLSHWDRKIRAHAPCLNPLTYHGLDRELNGSLGPGDVLLTSYGILKRDIERLKDLPFVAAFFDEIQNIKNPETIGYRAAAQVKARMKIGVTGTPIENRLMELKALFDLTLPGYLGTDAHFGENYVKPIEADPNSRKAQDLARMISPFSLRRRKETVLNDLPAKIEDYRTCRLSEDQIKLYRDAIESRAAGLLAVLRNEAETIPYIHIFALLNLLKQICNHPAMLLDQPGEAYGRLGSGKWELFKEVLSETLDSGQKVVVYSQFIKMLTIMEQFLKSENVDFVTLTGRSRNRGEIIARFNNDPGCRVYLGSLRAGGVGIDLVAASVVIHYDMWWNAAREDQATDRVHRIGQRKGVHVFKLITEGTLEEKIAALAQKKRNLMDSIVKETDANILKTFSREELIDLLALPHQGRALPTVPE